METVIAIAKKAGGFIFGLAWQHVEQQYGYLTSCDSNVDNLKKTVKKLTTDKQRIVEDAKRKGEVIAPEVQEWMDKVEVTVADASRLIPNEDNEGGGEVRCLNWPFPNMCLRINLSKDAKEMAEKVSEIIGEGGSFKTYSFPAPPQMIASSSARGYEPVLSRSTTLDEIKHALEDPNIHMIGVHGMGGVGKTTLVKELAWQAKKEGSFGAVAMATISNSPVGKIQDKLADWLDMKFEKKTEEGRAGELRGRMITEKSILVILDDIWGELDLAELGVPYGDEHKGCKLVLTSRDLKVLKTTMKTQREFTLEVLSQEESWNLFEKMAGDVVKHNSIRPTAVNVAKCCYGLPLLITTVAKALRRKENVRAWKDSLKRLQKFDDGGFHNEVYSKLEFSYECLESQELQSLFLLIGSFELDGVDTEVLLPICWGLGLYKDVHTLADARNRHYTLVEDLAASSLLLELEMKGVGMHDLVRDVAKSIASRTHLTYVVQRFTDINEWPKLQKCHHILLPDYRISELPEKLECPELKLLSLKIWEDNVVKVPDNFFSGMRKVKVLHLHGMEFTNPPPPSLRLLANLRSLRLYGEFEGIAIVGELTSLEILIVERAWNIKELPKEIGHLTRLRMLDFRDCHNVRLIPENLLSSLECLEELYLRYCPIQWEVEGSNNPSNYASIGELRNLHLLTTLELKIEDGSTLPRDLPNFENLERYIICIGMGSWVSYGSKFSRTLGLSGSSIAYILWNDVFEVLLTRVENLYLVELECVRDIFPGLNGNGFMELRHLSIHSSKLLHIINSERRHVHHAFPNLETLELDYLHNMKEICHGPLPTQSFEMLKVIKVGNCNELKHLLLWSHVRHLAQLHEMEISECQSMKEIVATELREEIQEIEEVVLPKLHSLLLKSLPMLLGFSSMPATIDSGLVPLALIDEKIAMPNLEAMELFEINTCKIWDDNLPAHSSVQNLTSLIIWRCGSLTSLFPSSVARAMVKLQYLKISSCQTLEEIFVQDENLGNHHSSFDLLSSEQAIIPNLKRLEIFMLDNLKLLWPSHLPPNSFCKLNEMEISGCPKLLNVFPSYVLNNLQNLETLEVTECDELGVIFEIQELSTVTTNQQGLATRLTTLDLDCLPKLKYIWSKDPHGILRFQNLTKVKIQNCESLDYDQVFPIYMAEELQQLQVLDIEFNGISDEKKSRVTLPYSLPNLEKLHISSLNYLKSLWHNELVAPNSFRKLNEIKISKCSNLLKVFQFSMLDYLPNLETLEVRWCDALGAVFEIEEPNTVATSQQGLATPLRTVTLGGLPKLNHIWSKDPRGILGFQNLRKVEVWGCGSLDHVFPISVAEDLQQLQQLNIYSCGVENIVEKSDNGEIKRVYLVNLEFRNCHRLKTVVPSSVVFYTLDVLDLARCDGVVNIMTSSTATNLPKLRVLKISECDMIEEIVASENDGDAASDIAFMKLEKLELFRLRRLRSFCRGGYSFKFPSLQTFLLGTCPMMETFCNGKLTAPSLKIVTTSWIRLTPKHYIGRWDGDLNTTIANIFTGKVLSLSSRESEATLRSPDIFMSAATQQYGKEV